jgi:phosphatidylserine decarboxylase
MQRATGRGLFHNADLAKLSDDNERNCFIIRTASGARIGVVQIAAHRAVVREPGSPFPVM